MSSEVSRVDVLAVMPNQSCTKIGGEPTYQNMMIWKRKINANLIAVTMPIAWGRGKGLLGSFQEPVTFLARNGAPYNPPANAPPAYPVIQAGATTAEREEARALHKIEDRYWKTSVHAAALIAEIGAGAFDEFVLAELMDPDEGLNGVTIRQIFDHVMLRFANVSQLEVDSNLIRFNEPMDPSVTLAVYVRRQERCQEVAADAEVPISEATMVSTLVKHAAATGGLDVAWGTWKARALAGQPMGWADAVTHWTAAFASKVELAKLTGAAFNGMANQAEEEMADKMVVALDNLANAAVEKNGTIETLVKANLALTKAVADRDTSLLALTTAITKFSNQRSKGGGGGGGGGGGSGPTADQSAFDPLGYCWSHGYKCKHGHSSATCNKKKPGHQVTAKRGDTQGGATWNQDWKP